MLNRYLALLLIAALMSTNFSRYFVYAGFKINQDTIAATLCENKARPWLHCNGRCYLIKKLRQAADNEKKQAARDGLTRLEVSLFQQPFQLSCAGEAAYITPKPALPSYTFHYSSRFLDTLFRPPRQVA